MNPFRVSGKLLKFRWLRFSLRSFLVLFTVFCIWLGWKAERAHRQREAVAVIVKAGGKVWYDHQLHVVPRPWGRRGRMTAISPKAADPTPQWIQSLLGHEFFRSVVGVSFESA